MNKYNIDELIQKCSGLDYFALIDLLDKEYKYASNTQIDKDKDMVYIKRKYADFAHEFLFYLHSGIKPIRMKEEDFCKIKAIGDNILKNNKL